MAKPRLGANTAPTTIAYSDSPSAGTPGANAALADHRHGMAAAGGGGLTDHTHAVTGSGASGGGPAVNPVDLTVSEIVRFTGEQFQTLSGDVNDLTLNDVFLLGLDPGGVNRTVHGFTGGAHGRLLLVVNTGATTGKITFPEDSGSAAVGNRFTHTLGRTDLWDGEWVLFRYDTGSGAWDSVFQSINPAESGDMHASGLAFGGANDGGVHDEFSRADHRHGMPADPVTAHAANATAHHDHTGLATDAELATHAGDPDAHGVDEFALAGADVSINSASDITVGSLSVTDIVVGNHVVVEAYLLLLNNSGGVRTYIVTMEWGTATFDVELTTASIANHASSLTPVVCRWVLDVRSSSLAYAMMELHHRVAEVSAGGDTAVTATHLDAYGHGSTATNMAGTQTANLKIRSSGTGGTQTARLLGMNARRMTP